MASYLSDGSDCQQFNLLPLHHLGLSQIVLSGWRRGRRERRGREEREEREGGEGGEGGDGSIFTHLTPE